MHRHTEKGEIEEVELAVSFLSFNVCLCLCVCEKVRVLSGSSNGMESVCVCVCLYHGTVLNRLQGVGSADASFFLFSFSF